MEKTETETQTALMTIQKQWWYEYR